MSNLTPIDYTQFNQLIGHTFRIENTEVDIQLAQVSEISRDQTWESFSFLFSVSKNVEIEQGTYCLQLDSGEVFELFLVPVGFILDDKELLCLESVFNRKSER